MNRKLIFLDVDGTLTEPGTNTPPSSALEAIRAARRAGHKVFLCSGRNHGMLVPLLPMGFDGAVCSAGGRILCGDQVLYDCPMTPRQRDRVLSALRLRGVAYMIECAERSYAGPDFSALARENAGGGELMRWRVQLERELGIFPSSQYRDEPVYKVVFASKDSAAVRQAKRELEDEFRLCPLETNRPGLLNGEFINRKFNKGLALERVRAHLGVSPVDTVAFGDSMNDLEMIQTAALGVCMESGSPELKKAADAICPPVGKDGLYRAFRDLDLLE